MCAHYHSVTNPDQLRKHFAVDAPTDAVKSDVWPGYSSVFIRRHLHADVSDEAVHNREAVVGRFGLIPHWSKDDKISRHTCNARSETVMEKPSFRDAWREYRPSFQAPRGHTILRQRSNNMRFCKRLIRGHLAS